MSAPALKNDKNIYNFCAGIRAKKGWELVETCIKKGDYTENKLQKTVRYYIANSGCKIIKKDLNSSREIKIEATSNINEEIAIKIDNDLPIEDYNINYSFYEKLVRTEIESVDPILTQQKLF